MNTLFAPQSIRWLVLFALAVGCLPLFTSGAAAADAPLLASASFQGNIIFELVSDRARLLQVSIVFVAFGIAMLLWRR
jgi:hypothetical protein